MKFSCFVILLYGTPAPSTECQHPEAWPASTYVHLRGVSLTFQMLIFERISWFGGKGICKYPLRYYIAIWKIASFLLAISLRYEDSFIKMDFSSTLLVGFQKEVFHGNYNSDNSLRWIIKKVLCFTVTVLNYAIHMSTLIICLILNYKSRGKVCNTNTSFLR